ncbi:S-adenosyl-L-methionine-dependent methyltransferase [Pleurotus eryngii]|uniref:S-adenosyl-L-methionine-dependent methyltransferase n=1 Tax=Pleurotus eryngii TaxID=5323 RepID=A0A9P5ZWY6_PLEER|nr:S-adenosyl-L-methionine-dependent methyltransferase [Pleurotus eryngii]
MSTIVSPILRILSYFANLRFSNSLSGSKGNISVHYDLPEELFSGFLSWDMTYSCAIFDDSAGGHTGDLTSKRLIAPPRLGSYVEPEERFINTKAGMDDLERGQMQKLHLMIKKARIKQGSKVLEIGCGWGSFAILATKHYGAIVDTLTISESQRVATEENFRAAGVSHLARVHLMDYRDMPQEWKASFDAVISIGVTEHVGAEYLDTWFRQISWAMKPENSFKVFTMTTVPDSRWEQFKSEVDFFRKYIYPGAMLGSVKTLVDSITAVGLNIESIEDISTHYTRTAREWGYRFELNWDSHIKPAFKRHDPELSDEALEIFRRKWRYYFAYCEGGFALRCIYDHLFVTTREVSPSLDREYILISHMHSTMSLDTNTME